MTWVDLSSAFIYQSLLTSTQMQNLRDNMTAWANGDSGAPIIQADAIGSGTITGDCISSGAIQSHIISSGAIVAADISSNALTLDKCNRGTFQSYAPGKNLVSGSSNYLDGVNMTVRVNNVNENDTLYYTFEHNATAGTTTYTRVRVESSYGNTHSTTSISFVRPSGSIDISSYTQSTIDVSLQMIVSSGGLGTAKSFGFHITGA